VLAQVLGWWTEFKQWHNARYPWLETVLAPAAQDEVARWQGVPADKNGAAHIASAQKIAEHANALRGRWLREGADPDQRLAWEREAGAVMMELDALRQQPDYIAVKNSVDDYETKVRAARADPRHPLLQSLSEQWMDAKNRLSKMESDALANDPAVQAAKRR